MQRATLITCLLWLLALSLGIWTLAQLPLDAIAHSISSLTFSQWILWFGLNGLIIFLLIWRWHLLTQAFNARITFWSLLLIRQAGQAVSFITPGPQFGGEPLQIYWLYKYGLPLRKALLSLGVDRFFELWVNFSVLLFAVLILLIANNNNDNTIGNWQSAAIPLLIFLSLMFALAWILLAQPRWLNQRLERAAVRWKHNHRISHINEHWQQLGDDLRLALQIQKWRLLAAILLSLLSWVGLLGELWMILNFVGIETTLHKFLLILVAMRMALLLPMPGGVGTLEASVLWSFHMLNLPASAAIGLIALMRLRDGVVLLFGLGCLATTKKVGDKPPSKSHFPRV